MPGEHKINGLTERQRLFAYEYLKDLNGTQAAIRAGYKPSNAKSQASNLLKHPAVRAIVDRGRADKQQHLEITQERILEELARIAFAKIGDYISIDNSGHIIIKPGTIDGDAGRPVAEVTDGGDTGKLRFKLHDKHKALELLGKHLGIFIDRHHVTLNKDPREMTDEELTKALDELNDE